MNKPNRIVLERSKMDVSVTSSTRAPTFRPSSWTRRSGPSSRPASFALFLRQPSCRESLLPDFLLVLSAQSNSNLNFNYISCKMQFESHLGVLGFWGFGVKSIL